MSQPSLQYCHNCCTAPCRCEADNAAMWDAFGTAAVIVGLVVLTYLMTCALAGYYGSIAGYYGPPL